MIHLLSNDTSKPGIITTICGETIPIELKFRYSADTAQVSCPSCLTIINKGITMKTDKNGLPIKENHDVLLGADSNGYPTKIDYSQFTDDKADTSTLTHTIVVCDTFSNEEYPVPVYINQDINEIKKQYNNVNMQRIIKIITHPIQEKPAMKHNFFTDNNSNIPKEICDHNGQVVLALCKTCGLAEGELTTNCPGYTVPREHATAAYNKDIDFIGNNWHVLNPSLILTTDGFAIIQKTLPDPPAEIIVPVKILQSTETCPNCGGNMIGDGYTTVRHCENADPPDFLEPDSGILYCTPQTQEDHVESKFVFSDECTYDSNCPHCKALYKNHDTELPFCEDPIAPICPNCGENMVYTEGTNTWDCPTAPAKALIPAEEYLALIKLTKSLLKGANLCMQEQNLIQPFFSIVKDNTAIIGKLKLFDETPLNYNKHSAIDWMVLAELLSELKYAHTIAFFEYNQPQSKETITKMLENSINILSKL